MKHMGKWGKHVGKCHYADFCATEPPVFKPLHTLPDSPANDSRICLITNQYIAVHHLFHGFLSHMVS